MDSPLRKILCIEDEPEMASLLKEDLLERGFSVQLAANGEEGLKLLLDSPPDLILCDIGMPLMGGYELLEQLISTYPRLAHIPFIFLTALTDRESELMGRKLGADDYITKPVDFDILATIINNRLARLGQSTYQNVEVKLTEREVEVLTWSAKGKTSDEIALILNLSKRTVDFHIDNAKEKLGASTRTHAVVKAATSRLIDF